VIAGRLILRALRGNDVGDVIELFGGPVARLYRRSLTDQGFEVLAAMSKAIQMPRKAVSCLRHAFVTLLVLCVCCAHIPTKFYKEGVTQEQFNTDRLDCHEEALGEAQHTDNPTVQAKVYSECMQKRGYKPVEE
jgi:hypothetical protein